MKNINEDLIKRSLLYMNYDSKKTLNENYEGLNRLTHERTNKNYELTLLRGATNFALPRINILKGSTFGLSTNRKEVMITYMKNNDVIYMCGTKNFINFGSVYQNDEFAKLLDVECTQSGKKTTFDWMANGNDNYWAVLKTNLEKNDLVRSVKESSNEKQGSFYYWNKFIVWRNMPGNFISHASTNITGKISNYNGKYAGQNALSNIELTLSNGEKSNVLDFITKYSSTISGRDSGVRNDPGKDKTPKPDYTPRVGGKNECKGTYSMGCITPEVGEAQQCLKDDGLYPYRVDNKFGSKTRDAVKAKIGKTYFTDADLQTICKTKKGGGGDDEYDFDKDMGGGSGQQEKEDTTWTGDVY
jgi:hypothetical protein